MSEIRQISYKDSSMEEALKEARKISNEKKGNEAIVDLGNGNLAIVDLDENEEELSKLSSNNNIAFEDKIKGKLEQALNLNTEAKFTPKVMEFSVEEKGFLGLKKTGDKTIVYSDNKTPILDNKISSVEIKSKNEFLTLKEAESAAKSRTGIEAVAYDEKTNKFYLVKVSDESLDKYTQLDDKGNRVFKSDNELDSKVLGLEKNKGKKIVSFIIPDKVLGFMNTDNVLRRSNIDDLANKNLNIEKDSKLDIDLASLSSKIEDFSKNTNLIKSKDVNSPNAKILLDMANSLKDPSFIQNAKSLLDNSDSLFLNTSATSDEKEKIKSQLKEGFTDLEKLLSKLSEKNSSGKPIGEKEILDFMKNNKGLMNNIISLKLAADFSGFNIKDGSIANILLEKNRITDEIKNEKGSVNYSELYKRLPESSNLSNSEKLFLAEVKNNFIEQKVQNNDSRLDNRLIKELKSNNNILSSLDENNVLGDIEKNGLNEANIEQLKKLVEKAKSSDLSPEDNKMINDLSKKVSKYESSKLENDLATEKALDLSKKFVSSLKDIQSKIAPNDEISKGFVDHLIGIQNQYSSLLKEVPQNSIKIAIFSNYMNKFTENLDNIKKHGLKEEYLTNIAKIEDSKKEIFGAFNNALISGSVEDAKSIILSAYKNFASSPEDFSNFEKLVNNTKSMDKAYEIANRSNISSYNPNSVRLFTSNSRAFNVSSVSANSLFAPNPMAFGGSSVSSNLFAPNPMTFGGSDLLARPSLIESGITRGMPSLSNYSTSPSSSLLVLPPSSSPFGFNTSSSPFGFNTNSSPFGFNTNSSPFGFNTSSSPSFGFNTNSSPSFNSSSIIGGLYGPDNHGNAFLDLFSSEKGISNLAKPGGLFGKFIFSQPSIFIGMNDTSQSLSGLSSLSSKNSINSSALADSLSPKGNTTNSKSSAADEFNKNLQANAIQSKGLESAIDSIEERAKILEDNVSDLYEDFDSSKASIVELLQNFRGIISEAESNISDIKVSIKKKLAIQLGNIMSITDTSKRRKLLDKLKEMDNHLFVNSKEVQISMKTYMEKAEHYSTELKTDDAKKVLDSYNKVLDSYNKLKNEKDPEKFLDQLDKYNDNLKALADILNKEDNYKPNEKEKFKLLDGVF